MTARKKISIFGKIALCSIFVFVVIQGVLWVFQSQEGLLYGKNISYNEPPKQLSSAYRAQAAGAGVAISTRIGMGNTGSTQVKSSNTGVYTYSSGDSLDQKFIEENLLYVREYLNYSRANIRDTLKNSTNKEQTLNSLISGFETRAKNGAASIASLEAQKEDAIKRLESTGSTIEQIKSEMESHFSAGEANATLQDVERYYKEREKYTEYFTQIVFINQFLKQYAFLIEYNSGILNTMKINKKALIDGSYVIVPESGGDYLKPLELIFDEVDITN